MSRSEWPRNALGAHDDRENGLLAVRRVAGVRQCARDCVGRRAHSRHEERDHRVDTRVGEQERQDAPRTRSSDAEPSMSTGLARLASPGSSGAIARTVASVNCGSSSPTASQASAHRIPRPPAFVRTATRRPRGIGCVESSVATSMSSSRRARADDARLMKECIDCRLGAGKRRGVRARRAGAGTRGSALDRKDGLRSRDTAGERPEASRISEGLEIEQDHLRRRVVLPPLEQVVRGDVGLVPDRDERGQARGRVTRSLRAAPARARRSGRRTRCSRAAPRARRTSR